MTASTSEGAKLLNTAELTVKEIPRERDEEDNLTEQLEEISPNKVIKEQIQKIQRPKTSTTT